MNTLGKIGPYGPKLIWHFGNLIFVDLSYVKAHDASEVRRKFFF